MSELKQPGQGEEEMGDKEKLQVDALFGVRCKAFPFAFAAGVPLFPRLRVFFSPASPVP